MLVLADDDLFAFSERFLPPTRGPAPNWTDPTTLLTTLQLTIQLIRLIASLHALHIVHGSLRPTTISTSILGEVHVHDFSCAFRTAGAGGLGGGAVDDGGSAPIRERGMKEESLPYLAPECSGRVGKAADYRADFYSIGATLFEILTGRPPFAEAEDPLEIIHAHIARRPMAVDELDGSVPRELALVVGKLLEKSPEERYQTSQGLIVDLETVASLIRQRSSPSLPSSSSLPSPTLAEPPTPTTPTPFIPGAIDSAAHFRLPPPSKMFGRESSEQDLLAAYDGVRESGRVECVVVKGSSGIGKTSLVERLRGPAVGGAGGKGEGGKGKGRKRKGFWAAVKFGE